MHKVRADIRFENIDEYKKIKTVLDNSKITFDTFVTLAVGNFWLQVWQEHLKQQETLGETTDSQPVDNSPTVSLDESTDTSA